MSTHACYLLTTKYLPPEIGYLLVASRSLEGWGRNSWGTGKPTGLSNAADKKAHGGAGASDAALARACSADERPGTDRTRSLSPKGGYDATGSATLKARADAFI